jgi:flagella basal body P-ring formation protein FlgA
MKNFYHLITLITLFSLHNGVMAQEQDLTKVKKTAEQFLLQQSKHYNGKIIVTVGEIDKRLKLHACEELQTFLPNGSKAWGKTTVGVRCNGFKPWTIFISSQVQIYGDYYQTRKGFTQGQNIEESDLIKMNGEVSAMPASIVTNVQTAIGKTMLTSLVAGTPLRKEMFKDTPVVKQGQFVKVTLHGNGFTMSNEAIAINNASEGQVAKAKTNDGQLISGIARAGGVIEVIN